MGISAGGIWERASERKPRRRESDANREFLGWHFGECSDYQEILHRLQGTGEVSRACANCRQEAFTTKGTKERLFSSPYGSRQRAADFPVMTEGIDYAADAPVVLFGDGIDFLGASLHSTGENGVGVRHRKDDSDCDAA